MAKKRKLSTATPTKGAAKLETKDDKFLGGDDVLHARDRLKGALQDLMEHSDDSSVTSHEDISGHALESFVRQSPVKKEPPSVAPPPSRGVRQQRKRRRRDAEANNAFHHTYVMKLFDRSVDLAQFREDTPLYPICRAWMANQPRNTNLVPKVRTPTPEPPKEEESAPADSSEVRDVYKMPPPVPISSEEERRRLRAPSPVAELPRRGQMLSLDIDSKPNLSQESMLNLHVGHWKAVRKKWQEAGFQNEARFKDSGRILRAIFKKAQEATG